MLRIHRVYHFTIEYSKRQNREDILLGNSIGVTADDVSNSLGILRNNASADLNQLFKDGYLVKINGKPVCYFDRETLESLFCMVIQPKCECFSLDEIVPLSKRSSKTEVFESLIGYDDSLQHIVNMAKASILYPPNGIHSILIGESGTGKSWFAETMYRYGVEEGIFKQNSSFIVFNCADYAANPQLLMGQLFGVVKGAYTGASEDRAGLVEKADGGVLFLDEVHRLPPEGQEMLFLLIDKKKFRRMGETGLERTVNILIISATTENPESSLLTTFLRRIPMMIHMPSLKERGLGEKIHLVKHFYYLEASNIDHLILVSRKCLINLATYDPKGNLGQIKADIQLSVARAYLQSKVSGDNNIRVDHDFLPAYTNQGLMHSDRERRKELELYLPDDYYSFSAQKEPESLSTSTMDLNHLISYFNNQLSEKECNTEEDVKRIFEEYTRKISLKMMSSAANALFINEEVKEMTHYLSDILYDELNIQVDKSAYLALAFYIKSVYENIEEGSVHKKYTSFHAIPSEIIQISQKILYLLEKNFGIYFPPEEAQALGIIINSLENGSEKNQIGIMVAAHGTTLATNIAGVVNDLLDTDHVIGFDMPLDNTLEATLNKMVEKINSMEKPKQMILFVDMGSLTDISTILEEKTGVHTVTVESTNVLMILEATRKAQSMKKDLNDILEDLIRMNNKITRRFQKKIDNYLKTQKKKVIYTVCISGEGTACYLEQAIRDMLKELDLYDIEIVPLSAARGSDVSEMIETLSVDKNVICVVGSIDFRSEEFDFIPFEEFILGNGLNRLQIL